MSKSKIKTIEDCLGVKYPDLPKQLEEMGVNNSSGLYYKFSQNKKYVHEVLDYSMKDNELIYQVVFDLHAPSGIGALIWLVFLILLLAWIAVLMFT